MNTKKCCKSNLIPPTVKRTEHYRVHDGYKNHLITTKMCDALNYFEKHKNNIQNLQIEAHMTETWRLK